MTALLWAAYGCGLLLMVVSVMVQSRRLAEKRWPRWSWRGHQGSGWPTLIAGVGVLLFVPAGGRLGLLEGTGLLAFFGGVGLVVAAQSVVIRRHNQRVESK